MTSLGRFRWRLERERLLGREDGRCEPISPRITDTSSEKTFERLSIRVVVKKIRGQVKCVVKVQLKELRILSKTVTRC